MKLKKKHVHAILHCHCRHWALQAMAVTGHCEIKQKKRDWKYQIKIYYVQFRPLYRPCLPSSGADPETVDGQLSYGAIFSIIDGTNCSSKAVLACRSVNLAFISFSVQQRKGTVIDFLKQSCGLCFNIISHYLSPTYSRFFNLYVQRFTYFSTPLKTLVVELFNICSAVQ